MPSETANINARAPQQLILNERDSSKSWKNWIQQFQWYSTVVDLEKKNPKEIKMALFMSTIRSEAVGIYNTFAEDNKKTLALLVEEY